MKWGLIEYEAERHVTLRQRLSDIAWLAGTIIGTIVVIRWFARVSLESGWLVP